MCAGFTPWSAGSQTFLLPSSPGPRPHRPTPGRALLDHSGSATVCPKLKAANERSSYRRGCLHAPGWRAVRLCHSWHVEHPFLLDGAPTSSSPVASRSCVPAGAGPIPPGPGLAPALGVSSRRHNFFPRRQNCRSPSAEAEPPPEICCTPPKRSARLPREILLEQPPEIR